jgi:hypothetical protein
MCLQRVLAVIHNLAEKFPNHGAMLNERYLHHFFSHSLQQDENLLHLLGDAGGIRLHPEWPTYKESVGRFDGGRYRKIGLHYYPVEDGRKGGFIDFTIGAYDAPEIAIEFSLKPTWSQEELIFDFVKLLDRRNISFKAVVSFNIILRRQVLPDVDYTQYVNTAYQEALRRLGHNHLLCNDHRVVYFRITEISANARRHWLYEGEPSKCQFVLQKAVLLVAPHPVAKSLIRDASVPREPA